MTENRDRLSGMHVVVGLSGGVDSAVCALRLREAGARVEALHMTNWEDDDGFCKAAEDLQDARRVCDALGITLHHVNFAAAYRDRVFEYFLDEYRKGRTPNPDVLCNREIKFGAFLEYATRLGADWIATGHYARVDRHDGQSRLLKGADRAKDQSYFLHAVGEGALARTLFPLGDLDKAAVRRLARDAGLPVFDKKDSTGICFIGERPFRAFLARYLPARPGDIETPEGTVVGRHHGLMYYTPGQRQGLGIGGLREAGGEPWYVADKDLARNVLIVVQGDHPLRYCDALEANDTHWINGPPAALNEPGGLRCSVKLRYRQPDRACTVREGVAGRLTVAFDAPQADVAPGQFAVFYDGDRCLGGAAIQSRRDRAEALRAAG